jgi:hypothetical protein
MNNYNQSVLKDCISASEKLLYASDFQLVLNAAATLARHNPHPFCLRYAARFRRAARNFLTAVMVMRHEWFDVPGAPDADPDWGGYNLSLRGRTPREKMARLLLYCPSLGILIRTCAKISTSSDAEMAPWQRIGCQRVLEAGARMLEAWRLWKEADELAQAGVSYAQQ